MLLASKQTTFVREAKVYYRVTPSNRLSQIGMSDKKKVAMVVSMKLHVQYLRSLEESDRVRKACLTYMQNWLEIFIRSGQILLTNCRLSLLSCTGD